MPQVFSNAQNKVIEVSPEEYQRILSKAGDKPTAPPPQPEMGGGSGVVNPLGVPLEELYRGRGRALAAGDKKAASQIEQFIKLEEGFAKTLPEPEEETGLGTEEQQFKANAAARAIDVLEEMYGRGEVANVGTANDLSLSPSSTVIGKAKGKVAATKKAWTDSDYQEDYNSYKAQLDMAVGILTQAAGSGTPQEGEAQRLINAAPTQTSTDEEVKSWFKNTRALIGDIAEEEKKNNQVGGGLAPQAPPTQPSVTPGDGAVISAVEKETGEVPEDGLTDTQRIAQSIADAAPVVMGGVAGFAGGALGGVGGSIVPGAGTTAGIILGGGAGMAAGTGAGMAVQNLIEDVMGLQDQSAEEQLKEAGIQTATATAVDMATAGAFKLLSSGGKLVLKPLVKGMNDIPIKSFRLSQSSQNALTKKFKKPLEDWIVERKLLGENGFQLAVDKASMLQDNFDDLALNKNVIIPIKKLNDRFTKEIKNLAGFTDEGVELVPGAYEQVALKVTKEWDNILKQVERKGITELNAEMLTKLRRATDKIVPKSAWDDPSVKQVGVRLSRIYNDVIQEAVDRTMIASGDDVGRQGLKALGQELSEYYKFIELAEKAPKGKGNVASRITRGVFGGGGAVAGGFAGGGLGATLGLVGGVTVESLLRDPQMLKLIYQLGKQGKQLTPAMQKALQISGMTLPPIVAAPSAELLSN